MEIKTGEISIGIFKKTYVKESLRYNTRTVNRSLLYVIYNCPI